MELIAGAEAPIMVAGGGAHLSGATAEVARFQEEVAIPVVTTMSGKGAMDETHPLSLGVSGGVSGRLGRCRHLMDLVESADVVFLVGTRMGFSATEAWSLYRNATTLIHLDIDPAEIGLNYEAERLVGDVGGTLRAMLDDLPRPDLSKREAARGQVAARIAEGLARHRADIRDLTTTDRLPLRPERMMTLLGELLPEDAIVTADASSATQWVLNYMEARRPGQRFLSPRGLAGLGWGYPMALGAKLARPEATVVSVVGDGGFAHNWAELETAVRMDLPVIVVVLNNGVLGYQVYGELTKYRRFTDACELRPVDHAQIARACGVDAVVVDSATGFADALRQALASGRSMLIDAICDPKAYPPVTALDPVEPLIDLTPVPEKQRRAGGEAG
jgi:acetolactate synthase-1/2/3 large subunit